MLNEKNYYSVEMNKKYMSNSQYRDFLRCEEMALATIEGRWQPTPSTDFLVGSYVHAWNDGTLEQFKSSTPELFTQKGELRSNFQFANNMIETLENDLLCREFLTGEKEVIMTANFAGADWKIKIDSYRENDAIVDLKTTRSIYELAWSAEHRRKVSFIEQFNYWLQVAVYSEVERLYKQRDNWTNAYIVAVSKETPPDKAIIALDDTGRIEFILNEIKENMPRILAVKEGLEKPTACGRCAYCRSNKVITEIISFRDLEGVEYNDDNE